MSFDVQVTHSVEEIGQEAWDFLGGDRPFTSYRWHRFGEKVLAEEMPICILLSRRGEPVARGTFWLTRREPLPIPSPAVRRLFEALLRRWPLLICRTPLANTSGLILPDPPLRDDALETLALAAQEQMHKHRASFLMFDYLEQHETQWAGWPRGSATATVPDPGTSLHVTWPDFESYLAQLSKSARKDYRRHRNRAADQEIVLASHQTVTAVDEAIGLIRNVERHHNSPPNPWARTTLETAGMVEATWLTTEINGRLVGCGLLLGERDARFLALIGLDYTVRYAYFQLVYAAVRSAIKGGVRILRGGGGVYSMKKRLGFKVQRDNWVVFMGSGGVFQKLGGWVAALEERAGQETNGH